MAKIHHNNIVDTINDIATQARERGISHLKFGGDTWNGRYLSIDGRKMLNFGTCGYLGLESHSKVKEYSTEFVQKYGTQYSISRAYATSESNLQLEDLLSKIFKGSPTVVFSSTTIAHISVLPITIRPGDAIIMDQQAHVSMQTAAQLVAIKGVPIEVIRHSNLDMLERKIKALRTKYNKIWYIIDGVYSMYGDIAPLKELNELASKYNELHFYVDDAHGMSWTGQNGSGAVFKEFRKNEKTVLVTTMAKGFGSVGGLVVFPNSQIYEQVMLHGGALAYSHPIIPAVIGASTASAEIHLSEEINLLQNALNDKITYCNSLLAQTDIPVLSDPTTPIYFLGTGQPSVGYNMNHRILNEGFYVNIGLFPAVPVKNTGLRFTMTNHMKKEDIHSFVEALKFHYPKALEEEGKTVNDVRRAFKLPSIDEVSDPHSTADQPTVKIYRSIKEIPSQLWDQHFLGRGNFDWNALITLEESFSKNQKIEDNWDFWYILIYDKKARLKLATFMTAGLFKDDLIAPASVSLQLELERMNDPYYLTSKTLTLGSSFTEGDHIYLDRTDANWQSYVQLLMKEIFKIQDVNNINAVLLRDFEPDDEIAEICHAEGFFKVDMPNTNTIKDLAGSMELHYEGLNRKHRKHIRDDIFTYMPEIDVKIKDTVSELELDTIYDLYCSIAERSFALNIFKYPRRLFSNISKNSEWEFICLYQKNKLVAAGCCYKSGDCYSAVLLGMDDDANKEVKVYKQILYQAVKRATDLKLKNVRLGLSADLEKRKVGAKSQAKVAFMSVKDLFNLEVIEAIPVVKGKK